MATIAEVSDGGRAYLIIQFIYYEIHMPCVPTMTAIAINFLTLTL